MTARTRAVQFAQDNLGKLEVPPGSNTGPFVYSCQQATDVPGTRWPWCVAFWVKAWTAAGFKLPYLGASAYGTLAWYQKNMPLWVVPPEKAKVGAGVVFSTGAGHLAMLSKSVVPGAVSITTIGGNEQDSVRETTRPIGLVRGIIDPVETGVTPVPSRKPRFEVVTSVSGRRKVVYASGPKAISRKIGGLLNRYGGVTIRRKKED